jgi:CHAT domain-containing protein
MAEAFFERGVQNYIGTGWPVVDQTATTFATAFYRRALRGAFLSDALAEAREAIMQEGPTWGAYQHYGQSTARLV